MTCDLHLHSVYSDGLRTPEELCALAVREGIQLIALSDHDTTAGLPPFEEAARACNLRQSGVLTVVPAIELSTGAGGRVHVLGYGVTGELPELQGVLAVQRERRRKRGARMLEKLRALGVDLPPSPIPFGRAEVARALMAAGVVNTLTQAFDRYLGEGKPGYVPLEHLSTGEAIALLHRSGALPVLAHPARSGLTGPALESLLLEWRQRGLRGLEVYHLSASRTQRPELDALARRLGLLVTGGSDYHGDAGTHAALGRLPAWPRQGEDCQLFLSALRG